ncbi:MAG TPA: PatB family C-S lyase [Anaerolineae bacterium]|nr:PatB family C-S lyase [Anaerolineae bacterium]
MTCDFDAFIDRRFGDSIKWNVCEEDELPLWVADMDFRCPEPVIAALQERVAHGIFGYGSAPSELREVLVARLAALYDWRVAPEAIVFLPGVVVGFNLAAQALTRPGDGLLIQTPIYPPFLTVAADAGLRPESMELSRRPDGAYEIDFDRFEAALSPHTAMFLLCNPHNPVGRVFRRDELERLAQLCFQKRVLICSDEIHCDFIFSGQRHYPIAALDPEIAASTLTLMAPSKTFNIPGLGCSFAVIPDPALRERFNAGQRGVVGHVNVLGYTAALAAYRDGGPWLESLLAYLEANRDFLVTYVREHLPGVHVAAPEGTYLAWLDCREAGIPGNPYEFFRARARVMLNDGATFGPGGEGFVRLNFGTPRALLTEGLERMRAALAELSV